MILDKDAFEQALQQDRQNNVLQTDANAKQDKKGLFGPQTDLTGMPLTNNNQAAIPSTDGAPTKEKTRRELMWEQRMQAKQQQANPPPVSGQQPTSLLDQMNPASRSRAILSPNNMPLKAPGGAEPPGGGGFQKATAFENPQTIIQIPQVAPGQI